MLIQFFTMLIKGMMMTGSYSNHVFPDPLSKEEEEKYITEAKMGNKEARAKLIEHNLRLVAHIVKKFEKNKDDVDDLISIGTIGLIKGIDSYSFKKGTRLTTYAARCIENEILMHFRSNKKNDKNVSINETIGYDKEGNEISLIDVMKCPSEDFVDDLHTKDNIALLKEYMTILSDREREILARRYGLYNYEELTQKEIAEKFHISRSYVSRIEKRALTKVLREFIRNNNTE